VKRYYRFCRQFNFHDLHPSPSQLTLYLEYLCQNLKSSQSVRNYLSAVGFIHRQLGLECSSLSSHQVNTMLRAIDNTLRSPILPKQPVTIKILLNIIKLCDKLGAWGLVCKCAFLFCFLGFLRQSNVAPRSPTLFDPTRDTLRADVHTSSQALAIRLKWTKTKQGAHHPIFIPLPRIHGSPLCPARAYQQMCTVFPATSPNTPLLIYHSAHQPTIMVTSRMLSAQFRQLIQQLQLPQSTFTLHSLRRGGATFCHTLGVPLQQIQTHGTWSSDAVWSYLTPDLAHKSSIANTMSQAVQSAIGHK
jgi:hypothetical protein